MPPADQFFAPCPRGLEHVLASELGELGAGAVRIVDGGVGFNGPYRLCYTVNLESRIASRVLWGVGEAAYRSEQDIYDFARVLPWPDWFGPERTIRVNVAAVRSPLKSLNFATLRIKDAICDTFRDATGRRPDVDTRSPDVRVHAFLTGEDCTLYMDTSGDPLFKRGYRTVTGDAPLRENLAAGILRLAGWQPGTPLFDPMCGSGTFLAEAAMMAANIAPGAKRRFGFERLKTFDRNDWRHLLGASRDRVDRRADLQIYGRDRDPKAVRIAETNLRAMGMAGAVHLECADILKEMTPPAPSGTIVTNPPYGVRIEEQAGLARFYPKLGDVLKQGFTGWTAYILTADMRLPKLIRLATSRRIPLYNGALDCRLFEYKLVEGSNRKEANRGG